MPEIFETFTSGGAFIVAMEYLAGQDLSELIRQGPVEPALACDIAIALCRFLEDAREFQATVGGREVRHLLHGDLTPRNIRLTANGVYILDFGISKTLSVSRKVTRNDFGNIAYLSPERLETGEMDATDGFWSIGVMLYEMLRGEKPHSTADARRLEQLILSRQPPEPLDAACPEGLRAIVGKLLAPDATARYESAQAIREDLERYASGQPTQAQAEGWPDAGEDQPATRRTRVPLPAEQGSRPVTPLDKRAPAGAWIRVALVVAVIGTLLTIGSLVVNEMRVYRGAGRVVGAVRSSEIGDLPGLWRRYDSLSESSYLRVGVRRLARRARRADPDAGRSRDPQLQHRRLGHPRGAVAAGAGAAGAGRAASIRTTPGCAPPCGSSRGTCIASTATGTPNAGNWCWRSASTPKRLTAFREAAELRPQWPEPFLGLARTFIASLADLEKGEDAIAQAQRLGRVSLEPETRMLAAGYRKRGDTFAANAVKLAATPQEEPFLTRARASYQRSIELYSSLPGVSPAEAIRASQRGLDRVDERLDQLVTTPVPEEADANTAVVNLVPQ